MVMGWGLYQEVCQWVHKEASCCHGDGVETISKSLSMGAQGGLIVAMVMGWRQYLEVCQCLHKDASLLP